MIQDGKLLPYETLPSDRQLGESLGVGRTEVREALRLLEAHMLIEIDKSGVRLCAASGRGPSPNRSAR